MILLEDGNSSSKEELLTITNVSNTLIYINNRNNYRLLITMLKIYIFNIISKNFDKSFNFKGLA